MALQSDPLERTRTTLLLSGRHILFPNGKRAVSLLIVAVLALVLCPAATAQSDSEMRAYQQVVQQFQAGDLLALERWVSAAPQGYLRKNGTQLLIWEYRRIGDAARAQRWATELRSVEPDNPLALAILSNSPSQPLTETSPQETGADQALSMAKRALRGLDQLKPIEGMAEGVFYQMKTELRQSLEGAVGYAYFQRNDYVTAREYLRRSVSSSPTNAQLAYALAISDLYGTPPENTEGYQMLARAVNLSRGTPAGAELARFAQQRFQEAGGSAEDWNTYLANTRPPAGRTVLNVRVTPPPEPTAPSQPPAGTTSPGSTTATTAASAPTSATGSSAPPAPATAPPANVGSASPSAAPATNASGGTTSAATSIPGSAPPSTASPATAAQSTAAQPANEPVEIARATPPDVAPPPIAPPRPKRKLVPAGAPMSIGILIETALTSRASREAVVNSLADMVRRLRETDEAFVMSFSDELAFEQDLTDNAGALEKAMDNIKPVSGTALYDAVAFASGHLKRVARNNKRVLIVVSDGSNRTNRISPLELSGQLNVSGLEIYCIGIGADTAEDQHRLRALADRTGGRALLTSDATQFRRATQQVAQAIGIPF